MHSMVCDTCHKRRTGPECAVCGKPTCAECDVETGAHPDCKPKWKEES